MNNDDIFNMQETILTSTLDHTKLDRAVALQNKAEELYAIFNTIDFGTSREITIAKEKLEEAVMWAVKGLHNEA